MVYYYEASRFTPFISVCSYLGILDNTQTWYLSAKWCFSCLIEIIKTKTSSSFHMFLDPVWSVNSTQGILLSNVIKSATDFWPSAQVLLWVWESYLKVVINYWLSIMLLYSLYSSKSNVLHCYFTFVSQLSALSRLPLNISKHSTHTHVAYFIFNTYG